MSDLSEFLLARIAEDEAYARDAAGEFPDWVDGVEETSDGENVYFTVETAKPRAKAWKWELDYFLDIDDRTSARVAHIARWDPARVLAECEAKRRIVGQYQQLVGAMPPDLMEVTPVGHALREVLWFLAMPYAAHRDYRQEWKP